MLLEHDDDGETASRKPAQRGEEHRAEDGGGARASSRNALKHGLTGSGFLIFDEEAKEFEQLAADMWEHLAPESPLEAEVAARIIKESWRLRRADRIEASAFDARRRQGFIEHARQEIEKGRQQRDGWIPGGPKELEELRRKGKERMDSAVNLLGQHQGSLGSDFRWLCGDKDSIEQVLRYRRAAEHSLYRAIREFERLKAQRPADPPAPAPATADDKSG